MSDSSILERLHEVVLQRKRERPADSYVVSLLDGGVEAIGAKVREEAEELIEAARGSDADAVVHEAADLLFHVSVLLGDADIAPARVLQALDARFGTGGLVEKAARTAKATAPDESC